MSLMPVPDWDPDNMPTPRRRDLPPFQVMDERDTPAMESSYRAQYMYRKWVPKKVEPFKPPPSICPWGEAMTSKLDTPNSTHTDSFMYPPKMKQLPSFKPDLKWEAIEDTTPMTTTMRAQYPRYKPGSTPRTQPCRPQPQPPPLADEKFSARSTSQDAYMPPPRFFKCAPTRTTRHCFYSFITTAHNRLAFSCF